MLALAGCSAEPAQESATAREQSEVNADEPPAMAEITPVVEETASDSAVPSEGVRPPEKSRPK